MACGELFKLMAARSALIDSRLAIYPRIVPAAYAGVDLAKNRTGACQA
jgi:hypothetical protein